MKVWRAIDQLVDDLALGVIYAIDVVVEAFIDLIEPVTYRRRRREFDALRQQWVTNFTTQSPNARVVITTDTSNAAQLISSRGKNRYAYWRTDQLEQAVRELHALVLRLQAEKAGPE